MTFVYFLWVTTPSLHPSLTWSRPGPCSPLISALIIHVGFVCNPILFPSTYLFLTSHWKSEIFIPMLKYLCWFSCVSVSLYSCVCAGITVAEKTPTDHCFFKISKNWHAMWPFSDIYYIFSICKGICIISRTATGNYFRYRLVIWSLK